MAVYICGIWQKYKDRENGRLKRFRHFKIKFRNKLLPAPLMAIDRLNYLVSCDCQFCEKYKDRENGRLKRFRHFKIKFRNKLLPAPLMAIDRLNYLVSCDCQFCEIFQAGQLVLASGL